MLLLKHANKSSCFYLYCLLKILELCFWFYAFGFNGGFIVEIVRIIADFVPKEEDTKQGILPLKKGGKHLKL